MLHPIVIIELVDNKFEGLYSNSELSFIIVNRCDDEESFTISGPYKPTLEKADLTRVIDGVTTLSEILDQRAEKPFFGLEEAP